MIFFANGFFLLLSGGENHIGSRGVPRELEIEDSMMPKPPDPIMYRVNTPPRTITLNSYAPEVFITLKNFDIHFASEKLKCFWFQLPWHNQTSLSHVFIPLFWEI